MAVSCETSRRGRATPCPGGSSAHHCTQRGPAQGGCAGRLRHGNAALPKRMHSPICVQASTWPQIGSRPGLSPATVSSRVSSMGDEGHRREPSRYLGPEPSKRVSRWLPPSRRRRCPVSTKSRPRLVSLGIRDVSRGWWLARRHCPCLPRRVVSHSRTAILVTMPRNLLVESACPLLVTRHIGAAPWRN